MLECKFSRNVRILFKLKSFPLKYTLSKIYYAFIHSYLTYSLIIWAAIPASNLSKLCRIQNKALRVISGTGWREHAPPLYAIQKILPLSKLVTYSVAISLFTNLQIRSFPQLLITFLPSLRKFIHLILEVRLNQTNIFFLFFHTLRTQRTNKFRGAKTWNGVPDDLKRVNFYHFKLKFKQYLLNNNYNCYFFFVCCFLNS